MSGKFNPGTRFRGLSWLLALIIVSGCQPGITPSPMATPHVLSIQVTPALTPLQPVFKDCAASQVNTSLVVSETPAQALDLIQSDLVLRWWVNPQPDDLAYVIGQEELTIIVSTNNPLKEISIEDIQAIYSGSLGSWPENGVTGDVQAHSYPYQDDIAAIFISAVLNGQQPSSRAVSLVPNPQAMIESISANPGAIGYLPRRWLDERVKEIPIQGILPGNLRKPILALSKTEPAGLEKDFLLCIQERLME